MSKNPKVPGTGAWHLRVTTVRSAPLLATLSGLLLSLSFPNFNLGFLAWFALIPLLAALRAVSNRTQAMGCGLLAGGIFFTLSIYWLMHVTVVGWLLMVLLESSFVVLFALLVFEINPHPNPLPQRKGRVRGSLFRVLWIALAWIFTEVFRSEIPVFAFGWNLLAYSQAGYPWIRLSADTFGAYGLSFAIAFVNAGIFEGARHRGLAPSVLALTLFTLVFAHGYFHSRPNPVSPPTLRISLVQGNIPQEVKWEVVARSKILEIYSKLTELASYDSPELIFWPEAAFPGYFNQDRAAEAVHDIVRQVKTPLLLGGLHLENAKTAYNSAYLLNPSAGLEERYDKLLLVPFGEFVPLRSIFGWLEPIAYALGVSDFKAGRTHSVFQLPERNILFSVLICFENSFSILARSFVKEGAQFLAVITNDAWFGNSSAPYQHLQISAFRAIENGVPVIQVANTGVSAFLSSRGEVLERVRDKSGKDIFITGKRTYDLPLERRQTPYQKGGYLFAYGAVMAFVLLFLGEKVKSWIIK